MNLELKNAAQLAEFVIQERNEFPIRLSAL